MDQEVVQQLTATADRLATATEALERVLARLDAQQEALNAKVDRIVAAIEEPRGEGNLSPALENELQERISELEKANAELKTQAVRLSRKTLPAAISALLSKAEPYSEDRLDAATLDKTLKALSVEQRIAVKAEMARAGIIE
jgi:predicted RNase H-like nuclease (RuvC/YqgF family)